MPSSRITHGLASRRKLSGGPRRRAGRHCPLLHAVGRRPPDDRYTVPTWYGYAGWGCLDYFLEQPGRYTLAEAFFANTQALVTGWKPSSRDRARGAGSREGPREAGRAGEAARKAGLGPQDAAGLLHDRDVLAFYGDPAGRRAWRGPEGVGAGADGKGRGLDLRDPAGARRADIRAREPERLAARGVRSSSSFRGGSRRSRSWKART